MKRRVLAIVFAVLCASAPAFAQGQQSGAVGGRVSSADRLPLPGATITVSSDALQGERTATTDINGIYAFPGLPPGRYRSGSTWTACRPSNAAPMCRLAARSWSIRSSRWPRSRKSWKCAARAGAGDLARRRHHARRRRSRRCRSAARRSSSPSWRPGVTDNTPNNKQVTIGGAFAYDNLFLMNGVDINDNVLGTPNNLFIEDAIEEVQVLTLRHLGRVRPVQRRRRQRDHARAAATCSRARSAPTSPIRPGASRPRSRSRRGRRGRASCRRPTRRRLGGPILRDRLWFFGGSRIERTTTQSSFAQTRHSVYQHERQHALRSEADRHDRAGSHAAGHLHRQPHRPASAVVRRQHRSGDDDDAVDAEPPLRRPPGAGCSARARSRRAVLAEELAAAECRRHQHQRLRLAVPDARRARRAGEPAVQRAVLRLDRSGRAQQPAADRQRVAACSSSRRVGTHEVKGGFEYFMSTRVGGNSQTSTGYVFQTDYKLDANSRPELDANGRLIPRFVPGTSRLQTWMPLRGAVDRRDDGVAVRQRSLDGGAPFDVRPRAPLRERQQQRDRRHLVEDVQTIVPRLAAAYDLTGDGRTILQGTYGHYAGKYNDVQFSRNSNVGNADRYRDAVHRPGRRGPRLRGRLRPGELPVRSPARSRRPTCSSPTACESPLTRSSRVGLAREIGQHGLGARDLREAQRDQLRRGLHHHRRRPHDHQPQRHRPRARSTTPSTATRTCARRDYQALDLEGAYRFGSIAVGERPVDGAAARTTAPSKGEAASNPAMPSLIGDYPEDLRGRSQLPDRPPRRLPAPQGARVGELQPRPGPVRPRSTSLRSIASTRPRPTASWRPAWR